MPDDVVTIFRNRLQDSAGDEYAQLAPAMFALASAMPGFVDAKTFVADDGERVTIVTFADDASQRAWAEHVEHRVAQRRGIDALYAEYTIQVATVTRSHRFVRTEPTGSS